MAKERRTDITGETGSVGKTTRRVPVSDKATDRNPAVGASGTRKMDPVRPGTRKTTGVRPVTRSTTALNSVTGTGRNPYVRKKKFPVGLVIFLLLLAGGGYYGWTSYQEGVARDAALRAAQQAEYERLEKERLAKEAELAAEKKRLAEEEARKKKEAEDKELAEIEAKRKAEAEAEAARKRAAEEEARRKAAEEEARRQAALRAANALTAMKAAAEEAAKLSKEGKFSDAGILLQKKLSEVGADLAKEEEPAFRQQQKAAEYFAQVMAETKVSPEADAKNMYWFIMKDGRKIRGKVDTSVVGGLETVLIGNGGVKTSLDNDKIAKRDKITQEQIDAEVKKALEDRSKAAATGLDWVMVGLLALENGKSDLAVSTLNTAEETDKDIAQSVREHKARQLLASGIFNRSIGNKRLAKERLDKLVNEYADTNAAKMYLASLNQEQEVIAQVTSENVTGEEAKGIQDDLNKAMDDVGTTASMSKAEGLVQQARGLEERAQSANNRKLSNELYKEAVKLLSQALGIYRNCAKDEKVDKKMLDEKMSNATSKLYWCRKLQTL